MFDRVRGDIREIKAKLKDKFSDVHELIRILENAGPNSTEKELTLILCNDRPNRSEQIHRELRTVI